MLKKLPNVLKSCVRAVNSTTPKLVKKFNTFSYSQITNKDPPHHPLNSDKINKWRLDKENFNNILLN